MSKTTDRCAGWQPIRGEMKDVDVMSDALAASILKHNTQGQYVCGWKA